MATTQEKEQANFDPEPIFDLLIEMADNPEEEEFLRRLYLSCTNWLTLEVTMSHPDPQLAESLRACWDKIARLVSLGPEGALESVQSAKARRDTRLEAEKRRRQFQRVSRCALWLASQPPSSAAADGEPEVEIVYAGKFRSQQTSTEDVAAARAGEDLGEWVSKWSEDILPASSEKYIADGVEKALLGVSELTLLREVSAGRGAIDGLVVPRNADETMPVIEFKVLVHFNPRTFSAGWKRALKQKCAYDFRLLGSDNFVDKKCLGAVIWAAGAGPDAMVNRLVVNVSPVEVHFRVDNIPLIKVYMFDSFSIVKDGGELDRSVLQEFRGYMCCRFGSSLYTCMTENEEINEEEETATGWDLPRASGKRLRSESETECNPSKIPRK